MRGFLISIISLVLFCAIAVFMLLHEKKHTDKISAKMDSYFSKLKEKRKSIRLDKKLDVVCKIAQKNNSQWSVFSKDISGDGICLCLSEILPQDAIVNLVIDIPGKRHISLSGRVIWVREMTAAAQGLERQFNAGVKFTKIKPKDKDDLVSFIKASLKS